MTILAELTVELFEPKPISVNKLYTVYRGKKMLNKKGKHFLDAMGQVTTQKLLEYELTHSWVDVLDCVYAHGAYTSLDITMYLDDLYNGSWSAGETTYTEKGSMRSPYKKKDATNYIKIIEDGVMNATGIDDSVNMDVTVRKRMASEPHIVTVLQVHSGGLVLGQED